MMEFDKDFLGTLFEQAVGSPRRRQVCDLRTSPQDTGQRALCALLPGTVVPIHRQEETVETVLCLCGKLDVARCRVPSSSRGNWAFGWACTRDSDCSTETSTRLSSARSSSSAWRCWSIISSSTDGMSPIKTDNHDGKVHL